MCASRPRFDSARADSLTSSRGCDVAFLIPPMPWHRVAQDERIRPATCGPCISASPFGHAPRRWPMKRKLLLLCFAATMALAAPASADQFLLGFNGFDYHIALPASTHYLDVGDKYFQVGYVTSVDPGLLGSYVDFGVNEYTYYMFNLTVGTVAYWDGNFLEADMSNLTGRTRYYEDPVSGGTHGVYGTSPPSATAPSTFIDGTIALGGKTYNFIVTYDIGLGQGDFGGNMDLDEGTDLIYIPSSQLNGWILGG